MGKHAYLIVAHNNFYTLQKLLNLIDDERNDIYIHIDKKVKNFDFNIYSDICKYSKVIFVPRINVYWGDYSQIERTLILFEQSVINNYEYYHLLSGVDLPIKTQDYIHDFFEKNDGKEFVGYAENYEQEWVNKIHLFNKYQRSKNIFGIFINILIRGSLLKLQSILKYNRTKKYKYTIKKGCDWFSLSHNLVEYIVSNKQLINDLFKYTDHPNEFFVQTLVWNSHFKQNLYDINDEYSGCVRYIDWNRGNPYVFKTNDFDDLINSNKLFARKFDENIDRKIIDKIYDYVKK